MIEGHRLHEARIDGRGVDPAGVFTIEEIRGPDGVATVVLAGELDMAASAAVRPVEGACSRSPTSASALHAPVQRVHESSSPTA